MKKTKAVKEAKDTKGTKAAQAPEVTKEMEERARKKLAEMNLLDDFLFGSVVAHPQIGQEFVRILLKTIFGREFKYLSVTAQKVFYGADRDLHGARLDVLVEPEERDAGGRATVYDIEPDRRDRAAEVKVLPRRVRFYHGKIIATSLSSGAKYDELMNVVVIMVLPFDPFGLDRMVYTVKNHCVEEQGMEYEDGESTVFLYTKGTKGSSNEALRLLLHYMEESRIENAVNDDLREVHRMVEMIKVDSGTTISCVRLMENLQRSEEKGLAKGEAIGRVKGKAEGKAEGKVEELVTRVCKKMKLGQTVEKIAEDLVEDISVIEPIFRAAESAASAYDPETVLQKLTGRNENGEI